MEDPTELSALTWRARKASLLSHHIPADDPRLQAADWGLKYWQTRTTFDRAASDGVIEASLRDTLLDGLWPRRGPGGRPPRPLSPRRRLPLPRRATRTVLRCRMALSHNRTGRRRRSR
jgi:hypothetical protein